MPDIEKLSFDALLSQWRAEDERITRALLDEKAANSRRAHALDRREEVGDEIRSRLTKMGVIP